MILMLFRAVSVYTAPGAAYGIWVSLPALKVNMTDGRTNSVKNEMTFRKEQNFCRKGPGAEICIRISEHKKARALWREGPGCGTACCIDNCFYSAFASFTGSGLLLSGFTK